MTYFYVSIIETIKIIETRKTKCHINHFKSEENIVCKICNNDDNKLNS